MESPPSPSWVSRLFSQLFGCQDLRVPSAKMEKYRNKITYNIPLPSPLSTLAEDRINDVCREVGAWIENYDDKRLEFREVMVKGTRDGSFLLRVTVHGNTCPESTWGPAFVTHLRRLFPTLRCVCYNVATSRARPTKDAPLLMLYGDGHLFEHTPTGLPFQISPDAFSEINHEVESLQYEKAAAWIEPFQGTGAILLVSGRDINSFGLGFGSIRGRDDKMVFSEVIAVQHCPLVHKDAIANFGRHAGEVKATVLHLSKPEMVVGVSEAIDGALERQYQAPIIVVTTGGRKGLHPGYLSYLKENRNVRCIVYNSCSTKSLERDMEAFLGGENGFSIDGFASYDFFPGTGYTASLTRLVRRPRTLVLPIGPAGTGKSTLARKLTIETLPNTVLWWQRDAIFSRLRGEGIGMNKAKHRVHENLLAFLRVSHNDLSVRIIDSTNGSPDARRLYSEEGAPELLILIVLKPPPRSSDDELVRFLLKRTSDRLGGGSLHPSFPETVDEQRVKHMTILKGICYPALPEVTDLAKRANTAVLHCNPGDEARLSALPFEAFLEFTLTDTLKRIVNQSAAI